jgi:hypothetical protein
MKWAVWLAALFFGLVVSARASAQLLSPGPLSRSHSTLEGDQRCNDCHSTGKRVDAGACLKCHTDLGARIGGGLGLHGREYKGRPCEGCHLEHQGAGARLVRWPGGDPSKLDHAQTGWPLKNGHASVSCGKCHSRTNARGAPTFLGAPTACASCHKDPHDGRFGATCTSCHDDASWRNVRLNAFNHDLARFPLKGSHARVPCAKCHQEPPKYVGLSFASCNSCHKDPHGGKLGTSCNGCHDEVRWKPATLKPGSHPGVSLAGGHAAVGCAKCHDRGNLAAPSRGTDCASCHKAVHKAPFGRACGTCHGAITWLGLPRSVGLGAHARTAYPLSGKHEQTACAACHKPELRERRYRGLKADRCIDCHADRHRGEFAKSDGGECKSCHTTAGYLPTLFGTKDHAATRFALAGKHAATACSGCHAAARPRLDLHVAKSACADCHDNPHGDQFAKEMKQGGCGQCHQPTGWNLPKIDHSTWPLTGAHAGARCESCHKPTADDKRSGRGASYRGVPRLCSGCHDDAHAGQLHPRGECDRCHAAAAFKIPRFDHDKVAGHALTGRHHDLACAKCHPTVKLRDGADVVRWKLPSTECRFCHADPHARKKEDR